MSKIKNKVENLKNKSKGKIPLIILMIVSLLMIVVLVTPFFSHIRNFLFGTIGLFAYPFFIVLFTVCFALFQNRKYVFSKKYIAYLITDVCLLICFIQAFLVKDYSSNFINFLSETYKARLTAGGIVFSAIVFPFKALIGYVGAIIVFAILFVFFTALIVDYLVAQKKGKISKPKSNTAVIDINKYIETENSVNSIHLDKNDIKNEEVEIEDNKTSARNILGLNSKQGIILSNKTEPSYETQKNKKTEITDRRSYILSTPPITDFNISKKEVKKTEETKEYVKPLKKFHDDNVSMTSYYNTTNNQSDIKSFIEDDERPVINNSVKEVKDVLEELKKEPIAQNDITQEISNIKITNLDDAFSTSNTPKSENINFLENHVIQNYIDQGVKEYEKKIADAEKKTENKESVGGVVYQKYNAPSLDFMKVESTSLDTLKLDVDGKKIQLENALEQFRVPAKVIGTVVGPAVTRYELEMPPGVSVKKLIAYQDDIALTLASNGGIRIEAPIPGRSAVGVEVPNEKIATIGLKDVIDTEEFRNAKSPLTVALGKDINGIVRLCDLAKAPHLLVAGSTNSGKSVCLNAILISLLYRCSPDDLKLILIDPKRVEFSIFNGLPHLIMPNVICDNDKAINAFNWTISEMEKRYVMFQNKKVRNIVEYNGLPEIVSGEVKKMPYIVFIVDELCDLMSTNKKEIEDKILRLTQKARAAGIHLILATQRPSVDVITGTIKNNLNSRIAFAVTSFADSKTILDQGGAEKLLGRGDMLYHPSDAAEPRRIQGAYITGGEVENIVEYIKANNDCFFDDEVEKNIISPQSQYATEEKDKSDGFDELLKPVLKFFIETNQASISLIQRKFTVGYPRAARIIDQMEEAKFISPSDGSKPRTVLINMDQYNEYFGEEE